MTYWQRRRWSNITAKLLTAVGVFGSFLLFATILSMSGRPTPEGILACACFSFSSMFLISSPVVKLWGWLDKDRGIRIDGSPARSDADRIAVMVILIPLSIVAIGFLLLGILRTTALAI